MPSDRSKTVCPLAVHYLFVLAGLLYYLHVVISSLSLCVSHIELINFVFAFPYCSMPGHYDAWHGMAQIAY